MVDTFDHVSVFHVSEVSHPALQPIKDVCSVQDSCATLLALKAEEF